MTKVYVLLLFSIQLLCSSCSTVYWQEGLKTPTPILENEIWRDTFFFGTWETDGPLDFAKLCPNFAFETIRVRRNPWQVSLGIITLGVYTPYGVAAVCQDTGSNNNNQNLGMYSN